MTTNNEEKAAEPQLIPKLNRDVGIKNFKSAGMGRDEEMFTATLTLDGRAVASVIQDGGGGGTDFRFRDRKLEGELETWAREVTGERYDALERIFAFVRGVKQLNDEAKKFARRGDEGAILILADPLLVGDEQPNPYGSFFRKDIIRNLPRLDSALEVAREEGAMFYMVSAPLPPELIADKEAAEKSELLKQAREWNKKDPTIRAAILIRATKYEAGTIYAVRTDEDIKRLIKEHGTSFYLLSEFLPEPSAEQLRAVKVSKANKQLQAWRKSDERVIAAVIYQKESGSVIAAALSREHSYVLDLIKRHGATSEEYIISDALPGVKDNPNAAAISLLQDRARASKKGARRRGGRK